MGIAPYKYFTYDGESSRDYDVYLTGDGVFNAPERAVEMLEIPGRNGNYALDQGKFNNISVTYKAGIVDYSESNFANKVSSVRNWLCSKVGYKRLSDDYNPNEYRMAVFRSGVNIDHVDLKTGEFEITFDCKPQRWLTSGETAVTVADGGTLSNPTPFEAEPLLAVDGYGTIDFNGYEIEIENVPVGEIILAESVATPITLDANALNTGDTVVVNFKYIETSYSLYNQQEKLYFVSDSVTHLNSRFKPTLYSANTTATGNGMLITYHTTVEPLNITFGYNASTTDTFSITLNMLSDTTPFTITITDTQTVSYNGTTHEIVYTRNMSASSTRQECTINSSPNSSTVFIDTIVGNSTIPISGINIDCSIGECYMIKNGGIITLNNVISLGSDLPKLASGTNTFAYDNTVTKLKVTPRWWKV